VKRRVFFNQMIRAACAWAAAGLLPGRASARSIPDVARRLYRGAPLGQILESTDGGASWRTVARFGADHAVLRVVQREQLYAELEFRGHRFTLKSTDARTWYTLDWHAPDA
jgi:photosystem II stability/assembly factor-like uncharacterized protein